MTQLTLTHPALYLPLPLTALHVTEEEENDKEEEEEEEGKVKGEEGRMRGGTVEVKNTHLYNLCVLVISC